MKKSDDSIVGAFLDAVKPETKQQSRPTEQRASRGSDYSTFLTTVQEASKAAPPTDAAPRQAELLPLLEGGPLPIQEFLAAAGSELALSFPEASAALIALRAAGAVALTGEAGRERVQLVRAEPRTTPPTG